MKGFVKVIIAGAVILGIGIAILIIALAVNGWKYAPDIEFETKEFTSTEENTALDVSLNAGKLKIEYRDDDSEEIYISYPTAEQYKTTIAEKDGKLSIENEVNLYGNRFSGCGVNWGVWWVDIPETVVSIPKDKITEISVTLNAGTVEVPDGEFKKVNIKVNAGTCNVGNVTGFELLDIDLNAGTVNVTSASGNELKCHLSAGSANIKKADCNKTEVKVSAGSANISLLGAKSDYTATVDVSAGSCNGISSQSGGDKNIKVKVSAGSCNVSFLG